MNQLAYLSHGRVMHARHGSIRNAFQYPVFTLVMDTRSEVQVHKTLKQQTGRLLSIHAKDYLNQQASGIDSNIRNFLRENLNYEAEEIWLQTFPRMLGYVFNPITFWFCKKGGQLEAVLCEVNNTFGEKHFYWVKPFAGISHHEWIRAEKLFHVSPFYPVDGYYKFKFDLTNKSSRVDILYFGNDDQLRLSTWVAGEFESLNEIRPFKIIVQYGWMTPMVVFRIHWQALKLWAKKVTFFSKPPPPPNLIS